MIYLSGHKSDAIREDLAVGRMGLLRTPANGYRLDAVAVWAMDNGCYTGAYPGDTGYLALLETLADHRSRCLFVAVPDVVGDAPATLDLFAPMARQIRALGWPAALVGQDGMESLPVPWDLVDRVFIGGSTDWKLGPAAVALIAEARHRGKPVHVGRVNSARRFARFAALGCASADGTYLAYGPRQLAPDVRAWTRAADWPALW
jgi:hypothetical protein